MRSLPIAALSFALGLTLAHGAQPTASSGVAGPEQPVAQLGASSVWTAPSGKARVIKAVQGDNAFLAFLQIEPGGAVPQHRDATEEYLLVVQGGGTLTIDGAEHPLTVGSTVYMAPNAEVSYANGPERTTVIQVFAGPGPADKYDGWTPALGGE